MRKETSVALSCSSYGVSVAIGLTATPISCVAFPPRTTKMR
nr:MAG TPA: hypothetical protein [Caudoviricetes sp.]